MKQDQRRITNQQLELALLTTFGVLLGDFERETHGMSYEEKKKHVHFGSLQKFTQDYRALILPFIGRLISDDKTFWCLYLSDTITDGIEATQDAKKWQEWIDSQYLK